MTTWRERNAEVAAGGCYTIEDIQRWACLHTCLVGEVVQATLGRPDGTFWASRLMF